jgi:hypothetical protein
MPYQTMNRFFKFFLLLLLVCDIYTTFLDLHSSYIVSAGLVVFWVLFAIEFSVCAEKKERKIYTHNYTK